MFSSYSFHTCSLQLPTPLSFFFFFNDTATTEIYTLSLHDALPISEPAHLGRHPSAVHRPGRHDGPAPAHLADRSEEHTSELQSPCNLVCRLLLEKKKKTDNNYQAVYTTLIKCSTQPRCMHPLRHIA